MRRVVALCLYYVPVCELDCSDTVRSLLSGPSLRLLLDSTTGFHLSKASSSLGVIKAPLVPGSSTLSGALSLRYTSRRFALFGSKDWKYSPISILPSLYTYIIFPVSNLCTILDADLPLGALT